ncbi:MAG TPA: hypothetical protein VLW49_05220 [Gaiellaceae bacterium]|nr:hypothetical protein [Gaiellaceae bacterium]
MSIAAFAARRRRETASRLVGWLIPVVPVGVCILIGWAIWGH